MNIYTVFKGKVFVGEFLNETPKGYRVVGGKRRFDHVVYKNRVRQGWVTANEQLFYTERAFKDEDSAHEFASKQLLRMESYYNKRIEDIAKAKAKLRLIA